MGLFDFIKTARRRPVLPCFGMDFTNVPAGQMQYHGQRVSITRPFMISKTQVTFEHLSHFANHAGIDVSKLFPKKSYEKVSYLYQKHSKNEKVAITHGCLHFRLAIAFVEAMTEFERLNGRISDHTVYRLPTEAEYAYAAAGPDSLRYPWGNTWDERMIPGLKGNPTAAGSVPRNASWCGALDMLSGGRAWCLDHWVEHPKWMAEPTSDPLVACPKGWSYSPVVKGWIAKGTGDADNMWRYFGSVNETDWVSIRVVRGVHLMDFGR